MATTPPDPGIDLFAVFSMLGHAGDQHSLSVLTKKGYYGFRPSHAPIIHLLLNGPQTVGEMAPLLQVTQQAVSKTVRELASNGYVEQLTDSADRRRRPVALTDRGREAVKLADQVRRELLSELEDWVGATQLSVVTEVAHLMMDRLGLTAALARRNAPLAQGI